MKSAAPMLAIVATLGLLQGGTGQVIAFGGCPDVVAKYDFSVESYMGTWYQFASYGTEAFQGMGKCVKAHYYKNEVTNRIDLVNTQIPSNRFSKPEVAGYAVLQNPSKPDGKLLVTLTVPVAGKVTAPLWILGTDYVSFSVVYSCLDFWVFHFTSAWVLSRDPFPSKYMQDEANAVLQKINLDISQFRKTQQSQCTKSKTNTDTNTKTNTNTNTNTNEGETYSGAAAQPAAAADTDNSVPVTYALN